MKKYILVAGSINMDLVLEVGNLPVKGETVPGKSIRYVPGGKGANQAVAAKRLGADVIFIGKVGNDDFGTQLLKYLKKEKLPLDMISKSNTASGMALITVEKNGKNTIVVLPGSNAEVTEQYINKNESIIKNANIVISQYEIPLPAVERLFSLAKKYKTKTILNPSPVLATNNALFINTDYLIINETELSYFSKKNNLTSESKIISACKTLQKNGPKNVIVTLGAQGVITITPARIIKTKGIKVNAIDTTGAGDCFVGALAAKLNENTDLSQALDFANRAASYSVTRWGASSSLPYLKDLTR